MKKFCREKIPGDVNESDSEEVSNESESVAEGTEENSSENVGCEESETKLTYPKKFLPTSEKSSINQIMDVTEEFGAPLKGAYQERPALKKSLDNVSSLVKCTVKVVVTN